MRVDSNFLADMLAAHFNRQDAVFRVRAAELVKQMPENAARRVRYHLERRVDFAEFGGLPKESVRVHQPSAKLDSLVLAPGVRAVLGELLEEVGRAEELAAAGLAPASALLLEGPPGTGKTSTASALAAELGLPLYCVRLEVLVGSHLGETGKNVAAAFQAAGTTEGVWLLDDFDALGWSRSGKGDDVGEARRAVNAALSALDSRAASAAPRNLLVCATNLAENLDAAVLRRFEHRLTLGLPGDAERKALVERYLGEAYVGAASLVPEAVQASAGLSHAAVARACTRYCKARVLGRPLGLLEALAAESGQQLRPAQARRRGAP